jgi:hypothetical protein
MRWINKFNLNFLPKITDQVYQLINGIEMRSK